MKKNISRLLTYLVFLCFFFSITRYSHSQVKIELLSGFIHNIKTPLNIQQNGYPDIKISAKYNSEPFRLPPYYDIRFSKWKNDRAWGIQFTHQKIYLDTEHPDVQRFSISHGLNELFILRMIKKNKMIYHLGAGLIIAHPESTIRNMAFSETGGIYLDKGYYLSGLCLSGTVGYNITIYKKLFLSLEARITGAWARVPVYDGHASVTNLALNGLFGLGWEF
jgi:hypothetical protein